MTTVACEDCGTVNDKMLRDTCRLCHSILPEPEGNSEFRHPHHVFDRPKFDVGMEWAAPGDNQEDVWKLFFHDRDCGEMLFRGPDAEKEAWAAWDRFAPSYNVNLFRQVRMKERPAEHTIPECANSPNGQHQVDTTMEEGPHHCFNCGVNMRESK